MSRQNFYDEERLGFAIPAAVGGGTRARGQESRNDGIRFRGLLRRGPLAWLLGVVLTAFYVVIYWFPAWLERPIRWSDGLARLLRNEDADRWFLYGFLYTLAVLLFGVRMLRRYRGDRYQLLRTSSVICFQLGAAFLLPNLLRALHQPEHYFSYFWPLKPEYLSPWKARELLALPGGVGAFMLWWGIILSFVATPILTYFYGKRWYCSWVCGCGGLAETAGDPFRQLSSKSRNARRLERVLLSTVLVAVILTTASLWVNASSNGRYLVDFSARLDRWYGFYVGALFSGVIGVGFYPIFGARVWCRFGCPMAAILGVLQRLFSRFVITTNGGQCIGCGNCSTYCEMGIDVRSYAQEQRNIVRSSCVGCGVCASVCPRGVLRLENGPSHAGRYPGSEKPQEVIWELIRRMD